MRTIDTSREGWQKEMDAAMNTGETFRLITSDAKLASALESGKFNVGVMN